MSAKKKFLVNVLHASCLSSLQNLKGFYGSVCLSLFLSMIVVCAGDYVLTSALRDRRFKPITLREIPQLKCHVSLLHSYEV